MITDHVWRPPSVSNSLLRGKGPALNRPCEYMNCRRPRAEHARAVRS